MSNLLGLCDFEMLPQFVEFLTWTSVTPVRLCSQSAVRSQGKLMCFMKMAFSRRHWRFNKTQWRSYSVLLGECLRSHGTHAALTALCFAFDGSWNNWQGSHIAAQSWIHDNDHASTFNILPATLEPKGYYALRSSYVFVSEWYPQRLHHPASVKPRIGKHYLRLMVHISNG